LAALHQGFAEQAHAAENKDFHRRMEAAAPNRRAVRRLNFPPT
jgi:hypothetical protein